MPEAVVRGVRHALGVRPVYKTVDTCAAEFAAPHAVPLLDLRRGDRGRAARAPGGAHPRLRPEPHRPGRRVRLLLRARRFALRDAGYETVMVNCNPETVSTDYDTSDRLYFEPLTLEDVLEVVHAESQAGPIAGVIVQLGGQTPLGLAKALKAEGVPILGTTPEAIDLAEDRGAFGRVLARGRPARAASTARPTAPPRRSRSPRRSATRCSCGRRYVLGGRGMEIVYDDATLQRLRRAAADASPAPSTRCSSTASSTTPSRSTSTRSTTAPSCTSAASWSTSRRPASTPATPRARCRRSPSARAEIDRVRESTLRHRRRASACAAC